MVENVRISLSNGEFLEGILHLPNKAKGCVLFAHGSGSSRHSPRNRSVAKVLEKGGLATLLFDLLTGQEEKIDRETAHMRFDIPLLTDRLVAATAWARKGQVLKKFSLGYFGASTGAAAALQAAAKHPEWIGALVSRGGRPDLAGDALRSVRVPTLLIVGGNDDGVIELNRKAYAELHCEKKLEIVPGATHLFEESGALEEVSRLARDWFLQFFKKST